MCITGTDAASAGFCNNGRFGYTRTVGEADFQRFDTRFIHQVGFIDITKSNLGSLSTCTVAQFGCAGPDVTVETKVISALDVPVIAAFAIPEKRRAETDRAIKVELNFIV
jgi:hypothetical protein